MEIASEMLSQPTPITSWPTILAHLRWLNRESLKIQAIQQSLQALRNVHPILFPTHHFSV